MTFVSHARRLDPDRISARCRVGVLLALLAGAGDTTSGRRMLAQAPSVPGSAEGGRPTVTRVPLPLVTGGFAIWGATGQDARGHIWFGVATAYTPVPSAHLIEYDPATAKATDRGNVVDELQRLGILRPGEHQAKIHSKIVPAPDGCLYFASMDEEGENEDGSRPPTWGGHLWRLRVATGRWEHLGATAEALIAVAAGDRFVYALGYFGHVLYQYDTKTARLRRLEVGSVDGHISRNFFSDYRGHVYVPRLHAEASASGRKIAVSLVEFGPDLQRLAETPIDADRYLRNDWATESHGIIAVQPMADRSIFFTTHRGYLYHVIPPPSPDLPAQPAASVMPIGWVHPDGPMYAPSLFATDDARTLFAVAQAPVGFQWLTCAVDHLPCRAVPLAVEAMDPALLARAALYGSATRDDRGGHYVVGALPIPGGNLYDPLVLRIEPRP
jgi:hypothetical protein